MKEKIKVYIARPYTIGDTCKNVRRQMRVYKQRVRRGFIPYAPLWSHFQELYEPLDSKDKWMEIDFEWVKACDCVLRLGGDSEGAEEEVKLAKEIGIPVFYSLLELVLNYRGHIKL